VKTVICSLTLALMLALVPPAAAQTPSPPRHWTRNDTFVLPPKEFGKPYNGWLEDHRGARLWLAELPLVPDDVAKRAVTDTASQFDKFALSAVGKTVAEVASNLSQNDWTAAAQFVLAAKGFGMGPEAKLTGAVLSNPVSAELLGRAVGIGANLSVDQWREAHALALQTSRARQARNDPAIAAQPAQPGLPCWLSIDKPCK
jgi:hypothetical protein